MYVALTLHDRPTAWRPAFKRFCQNPGAYRHTQRIMVVWASDRPRSAIISTKVSQAQLEAKIPAHAQDDDLAVEVATLEQLLDAHQLAHAHPSGSSADIIAGQIPPFAPEPDRDRADSLAEEGPVGFQAERARAPSSHSC